MSDTPEGKVKKAIRKWLDTLPDTFYFFPVASQFGKAGIPDIVVCHHGRFIGIEVKAPGRRSTLTDRQKQIGWDIVDAGGKWLVADSLEQVQEWWPVNG